MDAGASTTGVTIIEQADSLDRADVGARASALMALLLALDLSAVVDRMIFAVLAPAIQPALRMTDPQLGVVQGPAFALAYAAALPPAGWLVDRWGVRRVLVGSVATWTGGLALSATASAHGGFAALVAGRALCGVGQAAVLPIALGVIGGAVSPGRAGRAIALFTGAGTLGRSAAFGVGGLLLGWFAAHGINDAWAAVLIVLALVNVALLALVIGLGAPPGADARAPGNVRALWVAVRAAPVTVAATVVVALGPVIIVQAVTAWVAIILTHAHRLPLSRAAGLVALASLASPIGHLAGGWASDRLGDGRLAWAAVAVAVATCVPATMAITWAGSLPIAIGGVAALMLASGAAAVAGLARVQRLAPAPIHGTANGLFLLIAAVIGSGGGPWAVGWLAGGTDMGAGVATVGIVTIAATITVLAALRLLTKPEWVG